MNHCEKHEIVIGPEFGSCPLCELDKLTDLTALYCVRAIMKEPETISPAEELVILREFYNAVRTVINSDAEPILFVARIVALVDGAYKKPCIPTRELSNSLAEHSKEKPA